MSGYDLKWFEALDVVTVAAVKEAVRQLAEYPLYDEEVMHSMEDTIHQSVLRSIGLGKCIDAAACAREAVRTCDLDFSRHCA